MTPPTPETIRAALECIPPDMPRDEWARVAMALKSELGEAGFELFDAWSARGETYNAKAARDTWKSIKAGGAVGVGTLFHLAAQHGYMPSEPASAPKPTPAEMQASAKARAERIARDIGEREARQREAAELAAQRWAQAGDEGESPYLVRKGVKGHDVRHAPGGVLLVPMRNAAGELGNLQSIAPERPADGGPEKLFLKGGRKSGLWHWCGDQQKASALLVCEGYATGASVHEATGRPVAVAFDAGNLPHVAKAIRKAHPAALIVLCADNDTATEAKTGTNPGRVKAAEAARAVRGLAVWPEGLPDGGSDFNDLVAHAGLDAVRKRIEACIKEGPQSAAKARPRQSPAPEPTNEQAGPPEASPGSFDPFTVAESGVYFHGFNPQGKPLPPMRICSRLDVTAKTRFGDAGGWGYLLNFADDEGRSKEYALPRDALQDEGAAYRQRLAYMGLDIETSRGAREKLAQYIRSRQVETYARAVDRAGWHGRVFVLPSRVIGEAGERFIIQTEGAAHEHPFASRGNVTQWRDNIGRVCVGNSRMAFAVACAFASVLVRLAEIQTGGFHLKGPSSRGKTSALWAAGSVFGSHAMRHLWDSTKVGGEVLAAMASDSLLILDELKQSDARAVGDMVYMLGNGTGRNRGNAAMKLRAVLTWCLLFLSGGELTLEQHMASAGLKPAEGQDVRMPWIPAEPDGIEGSIFETNHEFADGRALSEHIERATARCHGAVGLEFIEWVAARFDELRRRIGAFTPAFLASNVPPESDGQVQRVATRFALVAMGGELATEAGLTGWPEGEATRAVIACFKSWLANRPGGTGSGERARMLAQVRRWLQLNGVGRFTYWHRALDDRAPDKGVRAGYRRLVTSDGKPINKNSDHMREFGETMTPADAEETSVEYFVFADVFEAEVCEGVDKRAMLHLLKDAGHLVLDKGRPYDCKPRLPGMGHTKCFRIKASIFEGED